MSSIDSAIARRGHSFNIFNVCTINIINTLRHTTWGSCVPALSALHQVYIEYIFVSAYLFSNALCGDSA